MSPGPVDRLRQRELGKIHLLAKQLHLDEATYRSMLHEVAGVDSAAKLDERGRRRVLEHLGRLAGRPSYPGRPHNVDVEPSLKKIEALLAEAGRPWAYADALAKHMYGVERAAWLRDPAHLRGVIAALHRDAVRHGRRTR